MVYGYNILYTQIDICYFFQNIKSDFNCLSNFNSNGLPFTLIKLQL